MTMWQATYATPSHRPSLFGVPSESCDRPVKQEGDAPDGWVS